MKTTLTLLAFAFAVLFVAQTSAQSCGSAITEIDAEQDCVDLESLTAAEGFFGCMEPADFNIAWNGSTNNGYLIPSYGAQAAFTTADFCTANYAAAQNAEYTTDYGLADVYPFSQGSSFFVLTAEGNYYIVGNIQPWNISPTAINVDFEVRLITANTTGCTDAEACNYTEIATLDDGTCVYPVDHLDCFGDCRHDFNGNGICDEEESFGCTYAGASNYAPGATADDGSCVFEPVISTCSYDGNSDGYIDMHDLLGLLTYFGLSCE